MKSLPNGSQQIVGLLLPGDFLGRPFGGESHASAIAATEVKLCWFPRSVHRGARYGVGRREELALRACRRRSGEGAGLDHAARTHERRAAHRRFPALGRAQRAMRRQTRAGGAPSAETLIELPISRTEMADYLGLTIETVSRQLARLRERGVVTVGASRTMVHPPARAARGDRRERARRASGPRIARARLRPRPLSGNTPLERLDPDQAQGTPGDA